MQKLSPETRLQRIQQALTETRRLLAKEQGYSEKFQNIARIDEYLAHLKKLYDMAEEVYKDLGFSKKQTVWLPAGWDKNNNPNPYVEAVIVDFHGEFVRVGIAGIIETITYKALRKEPNTNIIKTHGYTASLAGLKTPNGPILSVTREGQGGKCLKGSEASEWWNHLLAESDCPKTQAALCKAIYNA